MSSCCYGGKVLMKPDVEERNENLIDGEDYIEDAYPFSMPKVYLEGHGERYYPQTLFDWDDDSVVIVRDKMVIRYTSSSFFELLAKDENGNIIWVDGRNAPYEGCWKGEYLKEVRPVTEYTINEYNMETGEEKRYKMVLEETKQMNEYERFFVHLDNYILP